MSRAKVSPLDVVTWLFFAFARALVTVVGALVHLSRRRDQRAQVAEARQQPDAPRAAPAGR